MDSDSFWQDLRAAVRSLTHRPAFLVVASITLAVGIGATTALFSVVDAVLLRPLPYPEPARLLSVFETQDPGPGGLDGPSPGNLLDWRRQTTTLTGIAAWWVESSTILGTGSGDPAEEVPSARVTSDFFAVLGVQPLLGRVFSSDEVSREDPVAVLSYEFWQRRFGGDPSVVGRDVAFKAGTWRIVGVMPASFRTPGTQRGDVQLFKPWDFLRAFASLPEMPRDHRFLRSAARLAPGVSLTAAQAELSVIARGIAEAHPATNAGWGVTLVPMRDALVGDTRDALWILLVAVGCVLLLACANVTSLMLVRASGRSREMAVRAALGASHYRVVRQLLIESLLVAGLGGVLGIGLAWMGVDFLLRIRPGGVLLAGDATMDLRVVTFAIAASLLAGLLAGVVPALKRPRAALADALRATGGAVSSDRGRQRVKTIVVVSEIAIAILLLVGSGAFLTSFARVRAVDLGFDPADVVVARMRLGSAYSGGGAHPYYTRLLEQLRALPGVRAAGGTTGLPMDELDIDFDRPFWRAGEPRPPGGGAGVQVRMATLGYFETMRIPLVDGRGFDERDDRTRPRVLLVNQTMANRTWPGESPLGKRIFLDYQAYAAPYEVVGVVGDVRFYGHKRPPKPAVYIPHAQNAYLPLNLVIRAGGPGQAAALAPAVRRVVLGVDASQPVHSLTTVDELLGIELGADRFAASLMTIFAGVALLLATIGVYGVVAFTVSQRRREMGLRLALGADRGALVRLVLGGGLRLAAAGAVLGLAGTFGASRYVAGVLFETSSLDPAVIAASAVLLGSMVMLASYLPARRAAGVDPTRSLRSE